MNATAHHTHFNYANHGVVHQDGAEIANPKLTVYVELICTRAKLEDFCARHADLLANKQAAGTLASSAAGGGRNGGTAQSCLIITHKKPRR